MSSLDGNDKAVGMGWGGGEGRGSSIERNSLVLLLQSYVLSSAGIDGSIIDIL